MKHSSTKSHSLKYLNQSNAMNRFQPNKNDLGDCFAYCCRFFFSSSFFSFLSRLFILTSILCLFVCAFIYFSSCSSSFASLNIRKCIILLFIIQMVDCWWSWRRRWWWWIKYSLKHITEILLPHYLATSIERIARSLSFKKFLCCPKKVCARSCVCVWRFTFYQLIHTHNIIFANVDLMNLLFKNMQMIIRTGKALFSAVLCVVCVCANTHVYLCKCMSFLS